MSTTPISPDLHLLLAGFIYDGVQLDVYGDREGEVLGMAPPGSRSDVVTVLRDEVVHAAQRAVDAAVRARRQQAAEQIEFDRVMARLFWHPA